MGATSDVLQLGLLMALFACGLQYMRSTPGGEDHLQSIRKAMLAYLIPNPTGLSDYVVVPKNSNPDQAQPDAVRRASRSLASDSHEMKCDEEIPAYSSVTTNNVQIFAQGFYKGVEGGEHWWMYRIEFKNVGRQRVQLLARHWVFVDSTGKTVEVKGPGARGLTPKLSPGRTFKYESGTPLATAQGSMYGSFQFQVLKLEDGSTPLTPILFNARVGRLALTNDDSPAKVPCGAIARDGMVPLTSVWSSDRVIVGVTSSFIPPEEEEEIFGSRTPKKSAEDKTFLLDVQVNNGRDETIIIKRVHWTVRSAPRTEEKGGGGAGGDKSILAAFARTGPNLVGEREHLRKKKHQHTTLHTKVVHEGVPRGQGQGKHAEYPLTAGEALRYEDRISLPVASALIEGTMEVEVEVGDDEESDEDLYMFKEEEVYSETHLALKRAKQEEEAKKNKNNVKKPRRRTLSLKIARFAVSTDEQTIPDLPANVKF